MHLKIQINLVKLNQSDRQKKFNKKKLKINVIQKKYKI